MSRGTVILAGTVAGLGNKVEIRYWDGTVSWYGHLSRIDVRKGQTVVPGQRVGAVGNTGNSFGSHLHLEIHPTGGDDPVDPYPWLQRKGLLG
jgi:murein DD-endopeptidase MepM/ murein hydrolase activator NlpD